MQIIKVVALLAANLAVVQGCKCWSKDSVDLEVSEDCCPSGCWNDDKGSCDSDCLKGDDEWDYAICCAAEDDCSDCKYGCHKSGFWEYDL
ncbi:hypothetical protein ASPBRDRAFT_49389 [Aspergillus brasiliensis CBS 101740]|uniref:4Fe-4S ferredoxin-type domain-containing protein n=1 Tax=Aspergillus brasiliensis (strain CBS 101740 / IMI 381727 / IBT 21946) TaxID=767769 RepID=A0A1L9U2Q3_ASPBC|nr:hypothetical protein ASPBRDRAFT_49389 [Aspergillus brasiliensis CBS 101740]